MVERSYNQNSSNTAPPPPIHRVPRNNREPRTRATNITTPATCLSAASPRPPGSRAISSTSNKKSLHCKQSENRACLFWEFNGWCGVCLINRSLWTFQIVLSRHARRSTCSLGVRGASYLRKTTDSWWCHERFPGRLNSFVQAAWAFCS